MRVITGVENFEPRSDEVCVFLAGGISNCPDWQSEVIKRLQKEPDTDRLIVFNPRRENFPIRDPTAAEEQIAWEYKQLERMDIFSMFFCGGESDQPICMYELGRNLLRMQNRFPNDWQSRIVISVEATYKRKQDVFIQTALATGNVLSINTSKPNDMLMDFHAGCIISRYLSLAGRRTV